MYTVLSFPLSYFLFSLWNSTFLKIIIIIIMFKFFFFFLLFLVWTDWVLNRTRKNVQCDILHCSLHQTNTQAESFPHLCSSNKIHTAWIYTLKEYIIYPPVSFPTMWWASQNQGLISIRDLTECGGCGGGCYETAWTSFLDYRLK